MQAVAGPPCIRAPLAKKKPVWGPGPGSRWAPRVFCPQELSTVQISLGSRALSCRANVTKQPCGGWLDIPWECGSPPWARGPRGQCHCKMTSQSGLLSQGVTLSPQAAGDVIFLGGRKGNPRELVFRPLSRSQPESWFSGLCHAASLWLLRRQTSRSVPGPQFLSQARVSACSLQALQTHP